MRDKIIITIILLVAFFLRILFISDVPKSLYGDELTIVYDAYSIIRTGSDQLGNFFPLTFEMGAGRPPGYVYFITPFVALFGPNAWAVRLPSVLSGVGIVLLLYLISSLLISKRVGLFSAVLAAFSFWDISLSRAGFESHFALWLFLIGVYLFLVAAKKPWLLIFSAAFFAFTLHTYPTYKLFLPLFLIFLLWFGKISEMWKDKDIRKYLLASVVIFFVISIAAATQTFTGGSESRFSSINVFSDKSLNEKVVQKVNEERGLTDLPVSLSRFAQNNTFEKIKLIGINYLDNFSAAFLFQSGDRNPRHNMATIGELNLVEIVLIPLGLFMLWQKNKRLFKLLLLWLLLSPLPTAIVDTPHALRSLTMLPPLIIFSAAGVWLLFENKNNKIIIFLTIVFILDFIYFYQKLIFLAPNQNLNFWSYSAKVASEIIVKEKSNYDYIIVSDRIDSIEFAYPVYAVVDPKLVISENKKRTGLKGQNFKKLDNVYIGPIEAASVDQLITSLEGNILYIGPKEDAGKITDYQTVEYKGKGQLTTKNVSN